VAKRCEIGPRLLLITKGSRVRDWLLNDIKKSLILDDLDNQYGRLS